MFVHFFSFFFLFQACFFFRFFAVSLKRGVYFGSTPPETIRDLVAHLTGMLNFGWCIYWLSIGSNPPLRTPVAFLRFRLIPDPKNGSCHPGGDEPASWVGSGSNLYQRTVGCVYPNSVGPMVFIVFNLGILGDEIIHKYPRVVGLIGISHRGTLGSGYILAYPLIIFNPIQS